MTPRLGDNRGEVFLLPGANTRRAGGVVCRCAQVSALYWLHN